MLRKIRDIQKSLEAKAYLSALALALTLPDICGKIAYPNVKRNGERYAKWFDEYITKKKYPECYPEDHKFNGKKFWKLRNAFLHEGSVQGIPDTDLFELNVSETPGLYGISVYSVVKLNDDSGKFRVTLGVEMFCLDICISAEDFYNSYADKSKFNDQNVTITKATAQKPGER
jgi:hypothetical protein